MSDYDPPIEIYNQMPIPTLNQSVPLIDSTRWNDQPPWTSTGTTPGPGKSRGQLGGRRLTGHVRPTTQGVTVTFKLLTQPSGTTNAAFETDTNVSNTTGGVATVAAGATFVFSWLPTTPDWRIEVLAGGTAPSALDSSIIITPHRTSGL